MLGAEPGPDAEHPAALRGDGAGEESRDLPGSATLNFHVAGAPIARSLPQITTFALILLPKLMPSDQMVSVSLIWQLGHVGKGADVFAEPPY